MLTSKLPEQLRILARKHFQGDKHREATSMSSTLFDAADLIEKLLSERTEPPCLWDFTCETFLPSPLGETDHGE
jgi:hypothetical protein